MTLMQNLYSVLLVSASEHFNASLKALLPSASYYPVHFVKNISAAKRLFTEKPYDFVLINAPLPDENGEAFAIDLSHSKNTVVLLIVNSDIYEEVYERTLLQGVFSLSKPFSRQTFSVALSWLAIVREKLRTDVQKELSLEEKMAEIRLVNRAKWLLIRKLQMDEPQAHRYIEKQTMDRCITKREVAEILIKTYDNRSQG